jgi:hypothetical protein
MKSRSGRLLVAVAAVVVLAGAFGAWWWMAAAAGSGTPRLAVDRTEIDLGDFPFGARATAAFTLANTGDAPLRIVDLPPVKALEGC